MNKQTVFITAKQPIVVSNSVDEVKQKLRSAKEERSKFIYVNIYEGTEAIVCVDIIMIVIRLDLDEGKKASGAGGSVLVPPPGTFKK